MAARSDPVTRPIHAAKRHVGLCAGLCFSAFLLLPADGWSWGGAVHKLINRNAISNLPSDFHGFAQWADQLEQLATAADDRKCCVGGESIRHYIDIDSYSEFFAGTFPHDWNLAITQFGLSRLESNGIGPWALEQSYDQLVSYFAAGDWTNAVATAADIGHYAADLHQPLHLTKNFDGQETNQDGIHSRFESRMTGRHMEVFTPLFGAAPFVADPLARTFDWIDDIYPGVAMILAADLSAKAEAGGSTSSDTYYNALWEQVGQDTWYWIGASSKDIASLWYSAWIEAGSPALPGSIPVQPTTWSAIKALLR
jgi:hypothetical protein